MSDLKHRTPDVAPAEQWLTQAQFARAEGCDEKQVRRGLASGKLVARADGKLDRAQIGSGWRRPRRDSKEPDIPAAACPDGGGGSVRTNQRRAARAEKAAARQQAEHAGAAAEALLARLASQRAPVTVTVAEVRQWLAVLDWALPRAWSAGLDRARAREAAQAVLWEAATTEQRDHGHWGGFQLRARRAGDPSPVAEAEVVAGWGFELEPWEVVRECREWIADLEDSKGCPFRDPDEVVQIIPALLPALALPHHPAERQPSFATTPQLALEGASA